MDAEAQSLGVGLASLSRTHRLANIFDNAANNNGTMDVGRTQPVVLEQKIASLSAEAAACAPLVPLIVSWTMVTGPPIPPMTVTSGTEASNPSSSNASYRVRGDSDYRWRSTQLVCPPSSCTKESNAVARADTLRDFSELTTQAEADGAHSCSNYVNSGYRDDFKTYSRRNFTYRKHQTYEQAGKSQNWSRVVKHVPASLEVQENWPPLLLAGSKDGNSKKNDFPAKSLEDDLILTGTKDHVENLDGDEEQVVLYDQCWPSLEKLRKQHDSGCSHDIFRKTTLQPLAQINTITTLDPATKSLYKRPSMHLAPILLMVNKDFIVTSPLKENLMLTLALMGKPSEANVTENLHAEILDGSEMKRKVLVGQFKAFSSFLHFMLGHDATRVRTETNAGGTSTISECLSVEYFVRRFQAKDIVTEMEVEYCSFNWKKVDYICTLYGQRVGISVTRAMSFPDPKEFSAQMAYRLLHKKLFGLVVARHGVSKRHSFSQCILHVWCETQQTADLIRKEYDGVSRELEITDDVVMVLTVADGYHARPIFYESLLKNQPV